MGARRRRPPSVSTTHARAPAHTRAPPRRHAAAKEGTPYQGARPGYVSDAKVLNEDDDAGMPTFKRVQGAAGAAADGVAATGEAAANGAKGAAGAIADGAKGAASAVADGARGAAGTVAGAGAAAVGAVAGAGAAAAKGAKGAARAVGEAVTPPRHAGVVGGDAPAAEDDDYASADGDGYYTPQSSRPGSVAVRGARRGPSCSLRARAPPPFHTCGPPRRPRFAEHA